MSIKVVAGAVVGGIVLSSAAWAMEITTQEPHRDKLFPGNIMQTPFGPEDNTVGSNAVASQAWDLERFDVVGGQLSMTAGFNFLTGNSGFQQGDIFVYVNKVPYQAQVDQKTGPWTGADDWDFAVTFARGSGGVVKETSPGSGLVGYSVVAGGPSISAAAYTGGTSSLISGLPYLAPGPENSSQTATYSATGSGEFHNTIDGINLSLLKGVTAADDVYFYTAIGCGNDVMWGKIPGTSVPDGGTTLALLGLGLMGLAAARRKV